MPLRPRKSPFLNEGIRRAHELLKRRLANDEIRDEVRDAILIGRKWDADGGKSWVLNRRLKGQVLLGYDFYKIEKSGKYTDIDIPKLVRGLITKKRRIRILDAGAGDGNVLAELKEAFKDKVETQAISLGTPKPLKEKLALGLVDKIYNISVDAWLPKQEYDFIVSYMGGVAYSHNPIIAILKLAHSLSVDGIALIHTNEQEITDNRARALRNYLERRGFSFEPLNSNQMMITRIK
jgi:SAM-dependent methyltransferase